jgi:hypothetical protein
MAALVIFLTAASILLTISVPSYVMQAKREQEKELIFRGEEYTRAIQKYQRTLNLLPTSVDDLLSSNGTRFLRKAYADPVSGEPWRVIILNSDGTLTGSNIYPTMANVPTTTSVANVAPQQQQTKTPTNNNGPPISQSPFGTPNSFGSTPALNQPQQPQQQQQQQQQQRPPTQQQQQPQSAPTPLTGIVGVGSASKGTGVMVYNKQEQYSNWEFIAQLQQRQTSQNNQQQRPPNQQQQNQQPPGPQQSVPPRPGR